MLGKLIKHEFKATGRYFIPLFLVVLIMTPITKLITSLNIFDGYLVVIPGLFITLYVLTIIAVATVSVVILIMRFYKNLIADEGYLMHTLPVTPAQHILSKTFVSLVWTIFSTLVLVLSLFVFFVIPNEIGNIKNVISYLMNDMYTSMGSSTNSFLIWLGVLTFIGLIGNILYVYVSMAIGQVISRHRIIGAIAAAIVINVITQILSLVLLLPIVFIFGINVNDSSIIVNWIYPLTSIGSILMTVAYFFVTTYILKNKLNLE